ncbi:MAG: hypothetical protein COB12_04720 [Flavobacterium sp.]|nr:MAG: hypothetical protein COB12_04720 [Flavobacterium sp.]
MRKINYSYLKKLSDIIDCPCGCRASIKEELFKIQSCKLSPSLEMYHNYLMGKFLFNLSKVTEKLNNLTLANTKFDTIFVLAKMNNWEVYNPKYIFKTAHTKFELIKNLQSRREIIKIWKEAHDLTFYGIDKYPNNSSLQWLFDELEKMENKS